KWLINVRSLQGATIAPLLEEVDRAIAELCSLEGHKSFVTRISFDTSYHGIDIRFCRIVTIKSLFITTLIREMTGRTIICYQGLNIRVVSYCGDRRCSSCLSCFFRSVTVGKENNSYECCRHDKIFFHLF